MTALTPETNKVRRSTGPSPAIAVTLDQLVAPLDIPAELNAARWAPKWTLILPIAMLAAFTMPALPIDNVDLAHPSPVRPA